MAGTACPKGGHWRVLIDEVYYQDREKFDEVLRKEADRERAPDDPRISDRKVLLWAHHPATFSMVQNLLDICGRAGIYSVQCGGPKVPKSDLAVLGPPLAAVEEPGEILLGVQLVDQRMQRRVNQGKWVATDRELRDALHAVGARSETPVVVTPARDTSWGDVLRAMDLLSSLGLKRIEFGAAFTWEPELADPEGVPEADAVRFAQSLEQALADGKPDVVDAAVDRKEMLRRLVRGATLSAPLQQRFGGAVETMAKIGTTALSLSDAGSPPRFLGFRKQNGPARMLFRLLNKDGLEYWELVPGRAADGRIRIVDLFNLKKGCLETQRVRYWFPAEPESLKVLNQLRAPSLEDFLDGERWELFTLINQKKPVEACAYFEKHYRTFMMHRAAHIAILSSAEQVGLEEACKATERFISSFPKDETADLYRAILFQVKKEYAKAIAAIDALQRSIPDPYLDVYRAKVCLLAEDFAKAREGAEKAVRNEPGLPVAWWTLIGVCLRQKDFKATAGYLSSAEKKLNVTLGDLTKTPGYEEFVESQDYKDWLKSRP